MKDPFNYPLKASKFASKILHHSTSQTSSIPKACHVSIIEQETHHCVQARIPVKSKYSIKCCFLHLAMIEPGNIPRPTSLVGMNLIVAALSFSCSSSGVSLTNRILQRNRRLPAAKSPKKRILLVQSLPSPILIPRKTQSAIATSSPSSCPGNSLNINCSWYSIRNFVDRFTSTKRVYTLLKSSISTSFPLRLWQASDAAVIKHIAYRSEVSFLQKRKRSNQIHKVRLQSVSQENPG